LFGQELASPLLLAPIGMAGIVGRQAEIAAARAAEAASIGFCLSTAASCSAAQVAAATTRAFWFQLYITKDRGFTRSLIEAALAARCNALVVTIDLQVSGRRWRDMRNGFAVPPRISPANCIDMARRVGWARDVLLGPKLTFANFAGMTGTGSLGSLSAFINTQFDPAVTWKDLDWLRQEWTGPIVLKGILTPEDAVLAAEHGADGIVVSNHGGRQLDGVSSSIAALPGIVDAVAGRTEVLLDGGIRRGGDVVKALALGARACLVGRAFLYGLACRGQAGAEQVIRMLQAEIDTTLALLGRDGVAALEPGALIVPRSWSADE
jgi:L-lactate dehydrogenase (cytochrome)